MNYNWKEIYKTFDSVKSKVEYAGYVSDMLQIESILNAYIIDCQKAKILCSHLATKYMDDINSKNMNIKVTFVNNDIQKSNFEIVEDLKFFHNYIPLFAVDREIKSSMHRQLLGLVDNEDNKQE